MKLSIENIIELFINDTYICAVQALQLMKYQMEKYGWTKEQWNEYYFTYYSNNISIVPVITHNPLEINTVLHTKDGRYIGNAIIVGKDGNYNIIKTDYGNICKFTDSEIRTHFYIAYADLTDEEKQFIKKHKYSV